MDVRSFDALTREFGKSLPRRSLAPPLGGLLASLLSGAVPAAAKKKKKKATLCLDGQTIQASKKKKKKLLKSGATQGACPASPPPPPPPGCTPTCSANSCGGDDGCGGVCACAANTICHGGVCQDCDIRCDGNSAACGSDLEARVAGGGPIYVCPGRYVGNFVLSGNISLIGAGKGNDPAVDTILDANGTGRVLDIALGVTAALTGLRITGGKEPGPGGGILNEGSLTIDECAVTDNSAGPVGGGIFHTADATGPLKISNSTVADNDASISGGGLYLENSDHFVTISTCVISGNKCTSETCTGGGISNAFGTVTFNSASSVTGNVAPNGNGGGIYNDVNNGGTVTLNGADVSNNAGGNCAPPASVPGCVG